jgi:hypothetical protein
MNQFGLLEPARLHPLLKHRRYTFLNMSNKHIVSHVAVSTRHFVDMLQFACFNNIYLILPISDTSSCFGKLLSMTYSVILIILIS